MRTPAAWLRSAKRRKPGLYLYRTRRHLAPWRTEWGYAGMSTQLEMRNECHAGTCGRHQGCAGGKPWWDLVVRRRTLRLPWWLGWKWFLLSIETVLIVVTRPRYNTQKNPRRTKVPPAAQRLQRAVRDRDDQLHAIHLKFSRAWDLTRALAIVMIAIGAGGWLWTR